MNSRGLEGFSKTNKSSFQVNLEDLIKELNSVKNDMSIIKGMEISEEAKKLPLEELQKQLGEVKEKMHDCIDTL